MYWKTSPTTPGRLTCIGEKEVTVLPTKSTDGEFVSEVFTVEWAALGAGIYKPAKSVKAIGKGFTPLSASVSAVWNYDPVPFFDN